MTVPAAWEATLERFDSAWQQGGPPPDIRAFLRSVQPNGSPRLLLIELVKIDLECRWRLVPAERGPLPDRPRLEDYLGVFPELADGTRLPADLIGEEYRVRRGWDDRPDREEYCRRFGLSAAEAAALFDPIDAQLVVDGLPVTLANPVAARVARPPASTGELLETVKTARILSAEQANQLQSEMGSLPEPRSFVRRLLDLDWLTPFQAELLLKGRGSELTVGPYLLLNRIGQGWSSHVFRARHLQFDRLVALKVLRKELVAELGHDLIRRFFHEMQAIGRVNHPNVVHAYDGGPIGSTYFLAMEYVEGIDLDRLVRQSGPLPVEKVCEYARQVAEGLQNVHEQRLVHRDIKPSNLIIADGRVKILDLGFARLRQTAHARSGTGLTNAGDVLGSADYLAPEQALDPHSVDHRADLYSFGCTLFFLLTGQPPFAGGTFAQKLDRHQHEPARSVNAMQPGVPGELAEVVNRLLTKRPEERIQTAGELAFLFRRLSGGRSTRRRWLWGAAALAGTAVVGTGMWAILRRGDEPSGAREANRAIAGETGPVPALEFDGIRQFVALPDDLIDGSQVLTVETWFRTRKGGVILGCQSGIWPAGGGGFAPRFYVGTDGLLRAGFWSRATGHTRLFTQKEVNDQRWHHAALVIDSRGLRLFLDGELVSQHRGHVEYETLKRNQLGAGMAASDWPAGNGGMFYFEGRLREFRLWNVPRSALEIRHTMRKALSGKEPGLRVYYPMDGVQGDNLVDRSWNRSDGVLGGGDSSCRPTMVQDASFRSET
jgi:hypothetical protein